ncbi:hypothetical protein [Streptomyces sp. NPDC096152]|uniref:hypothetical protein n=1 Tax=Streptomyces sp. NPDC096152 TaxID=3366078 RepID=UPI00380D0331
MPMRVFTVTAAGVGAAVLAAAGITYASTAGSTPASPSVHRAARPVQRAAPAKSPSEGGSASGGKAEGRGRESGGRGYSHKEEGRVYFNERAFSASAEGCITAAGGLGSSSFNVFNDSRKIVEVFRGFNCDNGAPVATVGPHGATSGVVTRTVRGAVFGDDGVVGSFLVIGDHDEW